MTYKKVSACIALLLKFCLTEFGFTTCEISCNINVSNINHYLSFLSTFCSVRLILNKMCYGSQLIISENRYANEITLLYRALKNYV